MEETGGASAYGASLAGAGFDFHKFVRQPQTIVRILSWIFAIVVFACITTEGYVNPSHSPDAKCIFNQNDSACNYAVGIGVIAFLACVGFLMLDAYFPLMSNAEERKYVVLADLGFSGVWTFLWFVCFCLLASQWGRTHDVSGIPEDAARATVAFSFFSIATWGILAYFALGRYRRGVGDVAVPTYVEPPPDHHTPYPPTYAPTPYTPTTYSAYPSSGPDLHQQPPFIPTPQPQGDEGYQPPTY
ncbi:synaptogyrin-2b [Myripristis murdjan]|uniref:Synaptogyrin n=1 Tax=Myripristis murdjan TaxID=586833 RepID=A0A667WUX1_9TELE|nr:synaptogyrin-2-like [Myripristis murdjan]XP_029914973.1 synaptogyrin-2-like [Myripristis murdjan]